MKVLAAAIVPPHMDVSGGLRAAIALSRALVPHCSIELARLAQEDGRSCVGGLPIRDVKARLPLNCLVGRMPNKVRTPLYRSALPDCVTEELDLVHLHNPMPTLEMARVAKRCLELDKPYAVSTHGFVEVASDGSSYGLGPTGRLAWRFLVTRPLRYVAANATRVLALSPAEFPLLAELGVPEEKIDVVPNGIDLPGVIAPGVQEAARSRLGIPPRDGRPRALFLANHTHNKGLPILIEALLKTRLPFVLLAGGSPREEIDYDAWLRRCGPDQEILFTGFITDEEVSVLFEEADFFAFPTLADTYPLAVLEALAHGKPVLASRVGGIPYQVDEDRGRLIEPGDIEAWRRALSDVLGDPAALSRLTEGAMASAGRCFSWENAASSALDVYRKMLS